MGFGVPLDHWFRHELKDFAREVLFDPRRWSGAIPAGGRPQLLDEHQPGRFNHGYRLWALLILELWQREWVARFLGTGDAGQRPAVHPAQGNALGNGRSCPVGPTGQPFSSDWPVGPAIGSIGPRSPGRCPGLGEPCPFGATRAPPRNLATLVRCSLFPRPVIMTQGASRHVVTGGGRCGMGRRLARNCGKRGGEAIGSAIHTTSPRPAVVEIETPDPFIFLCDCLLAYSIV